MKFIVGILSAILALQQLTCSPPPKSILLNGKLHKNIEAVIYKESIFHYQDSTEIMQIGEGLVFHDSKIIIDGIGSYTFQGTVFSLLEECRIDFPKTDYMYFENMSEKYYKNRKYTCYQNKKDTLVYYRANKFKGDIFMMDSVCDRIINIDIGSCPPFASQKPPYGFIYRVDTVLDLNEVDLKQLNWQKITCEMKQILCE